jgi:hypothetical protein
MFFVWWSKSRFGRMITNAKWSSLLHDDRLTLLPPSPSSEACSVIWRDDGGVRNRICFWKSFTKDPNKVMTWNPRSLVHQLWYPEWRSDHFSSRPKSWRMTNFNIASNFNGRHSHRTPTETELPRDFNISPNKEWSDCRMWQQFRFNPPWRRTWNEVPRSVWINSGIQTPNLHESCKTGTKLPTISVDNAFPCTVFSFQVHSPNNSSLYKNELQLSCLPSLPSLWFPWFLHILSGWHWS